MTSVKLALKAKTVPIRSIALKPIDQLNPKHHFQCECEMCTKYQHKKLTSELNTIERQTQKKFKELLNPRRSSSYEWIIKHLMMTEKKLISRTLDVFIPEIVFLKDGEFMELFCSGGIQDATIKRIGKEKLTYSMIQKLFTDRRKKYREYLKCKKGKKKIEQKRTLYGKKQVKKDTKDAVVIRFNDGTQILNNQSEFLILLLKRKQDANWKDIHYIKNYLQVGDASTLHTKYTYGKHLYEQLYKRAETLIRIYGQRISSVDKDYISDEEEEKFCQAVRENSLSIYCEYVLYKIVHFIEHFYDYRILQIQVKFIVNEKDQIQLYSVSNLQKQKLLQYEWTNEIWASKVQEEEYKTFYSKKIEVNEQVEKKAQTIEHGMEEIYQNMKTVYRINETKEEDKEEMKNNEFFSYLHPNFKLQITQVLKDPLMTLTRFRKEHLHHKFQKKSIVKPFNSNMVNRLHRMTPQLHRAEPHDYISTPKKTFSTNPFTKNRSLSVSRNKSTINPENYD